MSNGPTDLPKHAWWTALKRAIKEFIADDMLDWAAALTYYSVLSIFPGMIVLISLVGLLGQDATDVLVDNIRQLAPGGTSDTLVKVINEIQGSASFAGPAAIIGLLGALWAASGYVGGFIRASNAIYEVEEGRPAWKTLPLRVFLTIVMVTLLAVIILGIVLTGNLADQVGHLLGLGSTGVLVWNIAKWPVLAVLLSLAIALLYWAAPNVRHPGFRWLTPGSLFAIVVWVIASLGFGFYVSNFASYNKVYGSLATVIVFLIWLWISNIAVLVGAELDAELSRERAIEEGHPPEEEPFLEPRDTRAMD
ncbi:MAG TPA: YihY/virulence factor BrkB family protein [Actinophytocola sp.]|uniref:YihY/virulence factor BrkB family protein n=1 Tax=Actinophytocola sp. TaxID=1872138 RepID=UPI002F95427B